MKYSNTITENKEIVAKYKKEIESIVPSLCDAIDDADYEKAHKIIDSVLNVTPIDQPNLNYCKSMISDAYYADTNKPWQRYMPFIEDMMKSVSLQVKIDGNILGVLGTFLLFSAMCYFINKDGQDYKINNSD